MLGASVSRPGSSGIGIFNVRSPTYVGVPDWLSLGCSPLIYFLFFLRIKKKNNIGLEGYQKGEGEKKGPWQKMAKNGRILPPKNKSL